MLFWNVLPVFSRKEKNLFSFWLEALRISNFLDFDNSDFPDVKDDCLLKLEWLKAAIEMKSLNSKQLF